MRGKPMSTNPSPADLLADVDPATFTEADKVALMTLLQRALDHAAAERNTRPAPAKH